MVKLLKPELRQCVDIFGSLGMLFCVGLGRKGMIENRFDLRDGVSDMWFVVNRTNLVLSPVLFENIVDWTLVAD